MQDLITKLINIDSLVYIEGRELTRDDFEIDEWQVSNESHWNHDCYTRRGKTQVSCTSHVFASVQIRIKQEVLDQLKESLGEVKVDGIPSMFEQSNWRWGGPERAWLPASFRDGIKYTGLRTESTKRARFVQYCTEAQKRVDEEGDALIDEQIASINGGWMRSLLKTREEYERRCVQYYTTVGTYQPSWIEEQANVFDRKERLKELREETRKLAREISVDEHNVLLRFFNNQEEDDYKEWVDALPTHVREAIVAKIKEHIESPPVSIGFPRFRQ